ncbi:MAG: hypothetical protein ACRC7O_18020, partial [Fimbriiglobus sp.]
QTALALARFGSAGKAADDVLKKTLRGDTDTTTRINALRTLTTIYGPDAKDLLAVLTERLETDRAFEIRVAAAEELAALGADAKPALPALRNARRDQQIKVREAATAAIKRIEAPTVVKP